MGKRLTGTLERIGPGVFFVVPEEFVVSLGGGKRPPVSVTVRRHTFRTTIAPMGGRFLLGFNKQVQADAGVAAGDDVTLSVELDTAPRTVEVPPDLAKALRGAADAKAVFAGLSYTHRKEYVSWILEARKPETRATRVNRTVEMLRAKVRTPKKG